jgi:hypothetical protein
MTEIVSKDRVDKLKDPNISKREYDLIIGDIGRRVDYIWTTLLKISARNYGWFYFQNGCDDDGGTFNPHIDEEFIELIGEYSGNDKINGIFSDGFPTRFLWTNNEDWKKEVLDHISNNKLNLENEKIKNKEKRETTKIKRKQLIESIKSKLTKEELKVIKFKN